jgi:tetratricopeptide (TPR) repeat protein
MKHRLILIIFFNLLILNTVYTKSKTSVYISNIAKKIYSDLDCKSETVEDNRYWCPASLKSLTKFKIKKDVILAGAAFYYKSDMSISESIKKSLRISFLLYKKGKIMITGLKPEHEEEKKQLLNIAFQIPFRLKGISKMKGVENITDKFAKYIKNNVIFIRKGLYDELLKIKKSVKYKLKIKKKNAYFKNKLKTYLFKVDDKFAGEVYIAVQIISDKEAIINVFPNVKLVVEKEQSSSKIIKLSLPEKKVALGVDAAGYKISENKLSPDGKKRKLFISNSNVGVAISIFMEIPPKDGDSKACRNYYWELIKKSPLQKSDIKMSEAGEMAKVEYLIKEYNGEKINQKNINAFISKGGIWIHIHLSKVLYKSEDEKIFKSFLNKITFDNNYALTRYDYFEYGSIFFINSNFKKAIKYYQKLFDLEKVKSTLDKTGFRILIINLGMSYEFSGDLEKAKLIIKYGLTKDKYYPMFYYNLACLYAKKNDNKSAIKYLKKAYKYKKKLGTGEKFPDPKKEPAFKNLLANPTFKKLVE